MSIWRRGLGTGLEIFPQVSRLKSYAEQCKSVLIWKSYDLVCNSRRFHLSRLQGRSADEADIWLHTTNFKCLHAYKIQNLPIHVLLLLSWSSFLIRLRRRSKTESYPESEAMMSCYANNSRVSETSTVTVAKHHEPQSRASLFNFHVTNFSHVHPDYPALDSALSAGFASTHTSSEMVLR